jgi:hypothetical protein
MYSGGLERRDGVPLLYAVSGGRKPEPQARCPGRHRVRAHARTCLHGWLGLRLTGSLHLDLVLLHERFAWKCDRAA